MVTRTCAGKKKREHGIDGRWEKSREKTEEKERTRKRRNRRKKD